MKFDLGYPEINKDFSQNSKKYMSKNPLLRQILDGFNKTILSIIYKDFQMNEFSLLDVGCGEGFIDFLISKNFPKAKIIGIDVNSDSVAIAKKTVKNGNFLKMNLSEKGFEKFDLVLCLEVLEHVEEFDKMLRGISNSFSKKAIISVPNGWIFRLANLLRLKYAGAWGNTPGHVNEWNKALFTKLLSNYFSDFKVKEVFFWLVAEIDG